MQTFLDTNDPRSLTKARGLSVFNFSKFQYGLLSDESKSRLHMAVYDSTTVPWSKHQYQTEERRALIPQILDYVRRHAAYRQIKLKRLKISHHLKLNANFANWHFITIYSMCSMHRRPHTINCLNVYNRQMAMDR